MKKSIGWLSLVMFIFVILFVGSTFADLGPIKAFYVQKAKYEGEGKITRVVFAVDEGKQSNVTGVRLYYWNGYDWVQLPQVDLEDFTRGIVEKLCYFNYDYYKFGSSLNFWDWNMGLLPSGCDSDCEIWWQSEGDGFYAAFDFDDLEPVDNTVYLIEVYWDDSDTGNSGTLQSVFFFNEEVDLPYISLDEKPKNKNKDEINVKFLDDGSMVVRWNAPQVNHEDTSLRISINIVDNKMEPNLYKYYWIRQPTHMGMLLIPSKAIEALKDDPNFRGFFEFQAQLRTNDNCNRSYSKPVRYYFE